MPYTPPQIFIGNCPEYNTGASKLNYAACQSNRGQCPPVSFLSSDLFKYLGCVPFQRIYTTPLSVLSSTHSDITENQTEETSATTYTIVLCIGIIGLAIVGLAMFISCKRRHRLQKANQKADDETVLENLVSSNEQNNTHKDSTQIKGILYCSDIYK
ncbi:uncharacterized protein LOC133197025 [Saccostrea echinata]|uniref:uncharacterized protein LOC133197025 n=1 Tax=Saccostrea echinata TaxID=191078 RepID=UPI002A7EFB7C|nr:uncharacterized protein LOC133197025 [Saccostrea echinata]